MNRSAGVDLRLVPAALAAWAGTALCLGAAWYVHAAVVLGLVGSAGWVVARPRDSGPWLAVIGALVMLGAGAVVTHLRVEQVRAHPLRSWDQAAVRVTATVAGQPRPRGRGDSAQVALPVRLEQVRRVGGGPPGTATDSHVPGRAVVFANAEHWVDVAVPGARIAFGATVRADTRDPLDVVVLVAPGVPETLAAPGPVGRWAAGSREALRRVAHERLPPDRAALVPAVVVGDTSGWSESDRADFRAAGLAHLAAVSGGNVAMVLGAVALSVRLAGAGPRVTAVAAAGALGLFVALVGPEPSVLRAAVMGAIGLLGVLVSRRRQAVPALAAGIIGLVGLLPELAVDLGFTLSVVATAAIVLAGPPVVEYLERRSLPRRVAQVLAVTGIAQLATLPVLLLAGATVGALGVPANLLVAPVVPPLTVLGMVAVLLAPLWAVGAGLALWPCGPAAGWMLSVARWAARLDPGVGGSGLLAAAAVVVLAVVLPAFAVGLSGILRRRGPPVARWEA